MKAMIEPHRPGWEHVTRSGTSYWLWAPREDRPQWRACWQNSEETAGDFARGDSLAEVLKIFPHVIRHMFRHVAE